MKKYLIVINPEDKDNIVYSPNIEKGKIAIAELDNFVYAPYKPAINPYPEQADSFKDFHDRLAEWVSMGDSLQYCNKIFAKAYNHQLEKKMISASEKDIENTVFETDTWFTIDELMEKVDTKYYKANKQFVGRILRIMVLRGNVVRDGLHFKVVRIP